jgi:transposase InsO family protein
MSAICCLIGLIKITFNYSLSSQEILSSNAYIERYNRTVRYDWLNQYLFHDVEEVQYYATQWLWTYNNERPNMALGGLNPAMKLAMAA